MGSSATVKAPPLQQYRGRSRPHQTGRQVLVQPPRWRIQKQNFPQCWRKPARTCRRQVEPRQVQGVWGRKRRRRTLQCVRDVGRRSQSLCVQAALTDGTVVGNVRLRTGMNMQTTVQDKFSAIFSPQLSALCDTDVDIYFC